jgi:hypothetical protein
MAMNWVNPIYSLSYSASDYPATLDRETTKYRWSPNFWKGEKKMAIARDEDREERVMREGVEFKYAQALADAAILGERIRRWQETHGIQAEDSVETLRRLREERDIWAGPPGPQRGRVRAGAKSEIRPRPQGFPSVRRKYLS